ncbi:MAG: hypothetical protein KDJ35_03290 [Alphaproteobacteria bacterium]|nr:hypothetical protein [Alphaproteobacteria bacterium]
MTQQSGHPYESKQSELKYQQSAAAYDYKKGWDFLSQKHYEGGVEVYIDIARQAALTGKEAMHSFCREQKLSFVSIPHEAFREYELSRTPFRTWFLKYCEDNNFNPKADVCIIEPFAKSVERASQKTETHSVIPQNNSDYLRGMFIFLKQGNPRKIKQNGDKSYDLMKRTIVNLETDERVIGHKNHFWKAHVSGFRAHKTAWPITVPKDYKMAGHMILQEVKIEHESQMDIDTLTRLISMEIMRQNSDSMKQFSQNAGPTGKIAYKQSTKVNNISNAVSKWGRMLYNKIHQEIGFDSLLSPEEQKKNNPKNYEEILKIVKEDAKQTGMHCTTLKKVLRTIAELEIVSPRQAEKLGLLSPEHK